MIPGLESGAQARTNGLNTGDSCDQKYRYRGCRTAIVTAVFSLTTVMWLQAAWAQGGTVSRPAGTAEQTQVQTASPVSSGLSAYPLGAGDVISIRVLGEDEFTKEKIRLTDAGTIFFPSIGEIRIKGITLGELEQFITNGLKGRILVNPKVSVEINEYRPFFITGMVRSPGSYQYQPGLTVRKATSLAGGLRERASVNKIFVIRERDASQTPIKVDLDTSIGPGDLITVEESFF